MISYINRQILPPSYDIVLYGSGLETEKLEGKVDYKGFVSSDELIATAEGEYGLAWYGSSLEGGSGALGEYLQYNAPHKMSLHTLRSSDYRLGESRAGAFCEEEQCGYMYLFFDGT